MVVSSVRGWKKELLPKVGLMQRNFNIWREVNVTMDSEKDPVIHLFSAEPVLRCNTCAFGVSK